MFREGLQIGSYKLIKRLGRGGFGQVWLAEKESQFLTKKVAVKLPHVALLDYDTIKHEATLWEQASGHPNVLPIIDADIFDDQVVIVSEYADGSSLAERIETRGKLTVKQTVEMTIGILNGLEFLHSKKIIHRDIKPQNILLQGDTPRLTDFGISRVLGNVSVDSIPVGTAAYMSPEAFDGKRNVLTDIWSVGVVLYELLKGGLPFPQENFSERMMAILSHEMEPLSLDVPYKLREIVRTALAKNPAERYQTAKAMRDDLNQVYVELSQMHNAPTELYQVPLQNVQPAQPVYYKPLAELPEIDMQQSQVTIQVPSFQPPPIAPQMQFQVSAQPRQKSRSPILGGALIALMAFSVLAIGAGIVWFASGKKTSEAVASNTSENSNTSDNTNSAAASMASDTNANNSNIAQISNKPAVNKSVANTTTTAVNTMRVNRMTNRATSEYYYDNSARSNTAINSTKSRSMKTTESNTTRDDSGGDGTRNRNQ